MSRFLPENHPSFGACSWCGKERNLVADLRIDAMLLAKSATTVVGSRNMRFKHALCGYCYRSLAKQGKPQIHLASQGILKRLTRKQTEKAARKLARDLKKMQDES